MKLKDKKNSYFECLNCGFQSLKYLGKCPQCESWNSLLEVKKEMLAEDVSQIEQVKPLDQIREETVVRIKTEISELDQLLGGGIVPASAILVGGEPGVGKSTLLLEVSSALARQGKKILYCSGEESENQIKLRANRLAINSPNIYLLCSSSFQSVKAAIDEINPEFVIIDSVQTLGDHRYSSLNGAISVLRQTVLEILQITKKRGITLFLVGHITKEGLLAGPKSLEHMVDIVLYFQGDLLHDIRLLRAEKNRFGNVNEVGVFRMEEKGLVAVADPSLLFLQHRKEKETGVAVISTMNGLRPILVEIQALVSESPFTGNPRRIAIGYDHFRLSMLLSLLEKKLHLPFYKSDVFLNIAGGLVLKDPAADLGVLAALISSHKSVQNDLKTVFLGEVGLTGEIRPVNFIQQRLSEVRRYGFTRVILAENQFRDLIDQQSADSKTAKPASLQESNSALRSLLSEIKVVGVKNISSLLPLLNS